MLSIVDEHMLSIVEVSIIFMHRITERSIQCSNGLSSQKLRKRGAYTLFCLWIHHAFQNV
jgi:hypothetical protein